MTVDEARERLVSVLSRGMSTAVGEPFTLSSGARSWVVFDCADAICDDDTLGFVVSYLLDHVDVDCDAVGGPALGAGPLVYGAGAVAGRRCFLVREAQKGHGVGGWFKGHFRPGDRVLVVEDVVTTGDSLLKAMRVVRDQGGVVVGAATLIDRGDITAAKVAEEFGVPYVPMTTYRDYGVDPVEAVPSA
ncbi:MAG TPA: phosphoribosyltransferase family protein [Acidimicrobiales bacterium]|nr:phosphoribosyltransferase family protein [Acidimicrobiales bacterium]